MNLWYNAKVIVFIITSGIIFQSCEKDNSIPETPKPTALFQVTYWDMGLVEFENLSTGADTYLWDFGNGKTSSGFDALHIYDENKVYTVTLKAINESGESIFKQDVNVTNIESTGSIIFWNTHDEDIKIYIDGNYVGTNTSFIADKWATPACGTKGFTTVTLPAGTYRFRAEEDSPRMAYWIGSFDIWNGKCRRMRLDDREYDWPDD